MSDTMEEGLQNWTPEEKEALLEDFYSWIPNLFRIKDPESQDYIGNMIGNRSKEDQILIVTDEGAVQKEALLAESQQLIAEVDESAKPLVDIMTLSRNTMKDVLLFFGGTFVLDTSVLDGTPLG